METFSLLTIVKNVEVWIFAMVIVNGAMAIVFLGVSFYLLLQKPIHLIKDVENSTNRVSHIETCFLNCL